MAGQYFELIASGDCRFEVMRWSSEQPAGILLPGATGGIRGYAELGSQLQSLKLPVAGMNPRRCGKSTGRLQGATLHDLAQDVIDVVIAVATIPALLIGHGGGNRIARVVAGMRPDLVKGVVLLAAGGKVPPDKDAQAALSRLLSSDYASEADRQSLLRTAMFAPNSNIPDDFFLDADRSPEFTRAFFAARKTVPIEAWWGGGRARMLVIQGKQDRVAPVGNGHDLKARFPERVDVVDLDDAGHALYVEKPREIARLIADFARDIAMAEA